MDTIKVCYTPKLKSYTYLLKYSTTPNFPPRVSPSGRWYNSVKGLRAVCTLPMDGFVNWAAIDTSHTGTLFRASQFLSEELPIRLAHRVQELSDLPDGLNEMPSIIRVQDWYAQSFEVRIHTPLAVG